MHLHTVLLPLGTALLSLAATASAAPPAEATIFDQLPGQWAPRVDGKVDCSDAQVISFDKDRTTATFSFTKPFKNDDGQTVSAAVYKVLRAKGKGITLYLHGEKRETAGGDPIVWTLVMIKEDAFVWRQTDWGPGESTVPFVRCAAPV